MAIIEVSEIITDTRWAKEIKIFGIPIYRAREINVKTEEKDEKDEKSIPIGFQQIGSTSLLKTDDLA